MALNSTRIADQGSGLFHAARPLVEQDGSDNTVQAQLVDLAHRKLTWLMNNGETPVSPTRTVTSSDAQDLSSMPSAISSNALTCLDKTILNVFCHCEDVTSGDGGVLIAPLLLDDSDQILGWLKPKFFTGYKPSSGGGALYIFDSPTNLVVSQVEEWNVRGAKNIGLHCTLIGTAEARIYAAMLSGFGDDEYSLSMDIQGTLSGSISGDG